mgnify:CR=1 FL=1
MRAGDLDRRVRIERPVADITIDGAGSGSWELVAIVWAQIRDELPSKGERLQSGINLAARPARVRMRWRTGIKPAMRIVHGAKVADGAVDYSTARIMQIVSSPAELGRRDGLELMVIDYSVAGNAA